MKTDFDDLTFLKMTHALIVEGWTKNVYVKHSKELYGHPFCYCLSGAGMVADMQYRWPDTTKPYDIMNISMTIPINERAAYRLSELLGFSGPGEMFAWNDDKDRIQEEVLSLLETAMRKVKNRGQHEYT